MEKTQSESLREYLYRRGMKKLKGLDRRDLILPGNPDVIEEYYSLMKRYSFRLVLREIIKRQDGFKSTDLTHFSSLRAVRTYLKKLREWGMVDLKEDRQYRLSLTPIKSFGLTLEWLTSQVFQRELGAETLWGTRFYGTGHGGDYDVIALMEGILCYVEVKSSPPKHILQQEVESFFNRIEDLLPHMAIFMVDTELRMKDKLAPMFEAELKRRYGPKSERMYPVERMERELFRVHHRVYLINTKKDIETNLRVCLRDHLRFRYLS